MMVVFSWYALGDSGIRRLPSRRCTGGVREQPGARRGDDHHWHRRPRIRGRPGANGHLAVRRPGRRRQGVGEQLRRRHPRRHRPRDARREPTSEGRGVALRARLRRGLDLGRELRRQHPDAGRRDDGHGAGDRAGRWGPVRRDLRRRRGLGDRLHRRDGLPGRRRDQRPHRRQGRGHTGGDRADARRGLGAPPHQRQPRADRYDDAGGDDGQARPGHRLDRVRPARRVGGQRDDGHAWPGWTRRPARSWRR